MTPQERKKIEKWSKKKARGAFLQMPSYLQEHTKRKSIQVAMKNNRAVGIYLRKIDAPQSIIDEVNEKAWRKRIEKEEKQKNENTEKDKTEAQNKETSVKKAKVIEERASQ